MHLIHICGFKVKYQTDFNLFTKIIRIANYIFWMKNGVFTCHCLSHHGAGDHSENE